MSIGPIVELPAARLPDLEALLVANALPADDCAAQAGCFCAVFDADRLIAAGGLEPAGDYALLRSLVVHPDYRGRGLARALSAHLLQRARAQGSAAVYLLTESAAAWFENIGFRRTERASVPAEIAATRQFAALCPDTAVCLKIELSAR